MKYLYQIVLFLSGIFSLSAQSLFSGGDGTESNPYLISTEADLRELARQVNEASNTFEGKFLKQTADITFTPVDIVPIGGPVTGDATDIPDEEAFRGTYDGDHKKIYNLNIYGVQELDGGEQSNMQVGLFGTLGSGAVIKNVVVASGHIYGFSHVGAIVGIMHANTLVSGCKVGPDVRIFAWAQGAGIVGGTTGKNVAILECANYANVYVYGTGNYKGAGGITAYTAEARIEGCANFGDIWGKGGFVGGIIGGQPTASPDFQYDYPTIKSCINAGDVTAEDVGAGGILGATGYNLVNPDGSPRPLELISNSYSYGQSFTSYSRTNGPVVAWFVKDMGLSVSKTYYNTDRFVMKPDASSDAEVAFAMGEGKSHAEMTSNAFLQELNEGSAYPFEEDKHHFNANMPVLKWINDTYDPEIDNPNQYRKDLSPSTYKKAAGTLFRPNRSGEFIFFNQDMLQPDVQSKSFGCSIDYGWVPRVLPQKGGKDYTYFLSSSAFRRPIAEDGSYVTPKPALSADHWLITPAFTVENGKHFFHWVAGSEDASLQCGYEVYVIDDENATTPDAFADLDPIFKVDAEEIIREEKENLDNGESYYYVLNERKIDLSAYIGKKVRVAFRDNNTNKFFLTIGMMNVGSAESSAPIVSKAVSVSVDNGVICIEGTPTQRMELFDIHGYRVASSVESLRYEAVPGTYIAVVYDAHGGSATQKILVD